MRVVLIASGVVLALGAGRASPMSAQLPATYTNLRVIRQDVSAQDLVTQMKAFATSLGARCEQCHVGEGPDLSQFDFASDAKPDKAIARRMLLLVRAVNAALLAGVGDPARPIKVTCYTCHRGALKPRTTPPVNPGAP